MADPERISSGLSLPQWMKTKANNEHARDFDAQFASPPAHDDSFFLIRYPGAGSLLSGATSKVSSTPQVVTASSTTQASTLNTIKGKDWSRHTQPCQQFIDGVPFGTLSKCPPTIKPKPAGTDDGFKGEGAACGSSIVKVAHKIISSRSGNQSRGMSVEPIHEEGIYQMTKGHDESNPNSNIKDQLAPSSAYLSMRRGSKSLPTTPLSSPPGSPGSKRKNNAGNRFFTGPFEPSDNSGSRSWNLAGLLGQQRESYTSSSALNEDTQVSLAASVECLGPSPNADAAKLSQQFASNQESSSTKAQVYRPKPSELREMNFWSPTSM